MRSIKYKRMLGRTLLSLLMMLMVTGSAFAAITYPVKVGSSITFYKDEYVQYGPDYTKSGTYKMYATTAADSTKRNVYCLQPWMDNPGAGKRTISTIYDATTTSVYAETIRNLMYYSQRYGGSSWANSNWYINRSGSTYDMAWVSTENEKTAVMHLAVSMAYYQWKNDGKALSKMPAYSGGTVKAYTYEKYWNAAYAIYQAALRVAKGSTGSFTMDGATIAIPEKAPNSFAVAVIKVSGKQDLIYGVSGVKMNGTIKLTKSSSNTLYTNGNTEYNFEGIKYAVYTNSLCTSTATSSALVPGGSVSLNEGTYYVKEIQTNTKYKINPEVYTATVKVNGTVNIEATDDPVTTTVSFNKTSTPNRPSSVDLSGFKFTLTGEWSNSAPSFAAVSDRNGKVTFSDIPLGRYRLTEDTDSIQDKNESLEGGFFQKGEMIDCDVTVSGATDELISSAAAACNPFISDPTELNVTVTKLIEDEDGNPIAGLSKRGFKINLAGTSDKGDSVNLVETTDINGEAKFSAVPLGTYTVSEQRQDEQTQYYTPKNGGTATVVLDEKDQYLSITNVVKTSEVILKKTSVDNQVAGIEFTLTGTDFDGNEIQPITANTDKDGIINFGKVLPGTYFIEESGFDASTYRFDDAYRISGFDNPTVKVDVTGAEESQEVDFENLTYSITVIKTEVLEDGTATDNPVVGAEYALFKSLDDENEYQCSDVLATDENGKLTFIVGEGDYRLREVTTPGGYISVTGADYTDITISDSNPSPTIRTSNQREYGSVSVYKYDEATNDPVPDAGFSLYRDEDCMQLVKELDLTDSRGQATADDLEWGIYYLKETRVPRGYRALDNPIKVTIGRWFDENSQEYRACVDTELAISNEEIPGRVKLTKLDAETEQVIKNNPATFSLYTSDGDLVKENCRTSNDGILKVEGLAWGAYYFEETVAPSGYGLMTEPVRFTVNSYSASDDEYQEITAADPVLSNTIVATKSLVAEDVWYDHGTPTFMFTLTGTDINGKKHTYNKPVTFSDDYVNKHTAIDGTVSISATFTGITAGHYTLSEGETMRYRLGRISDLSDNAEVKGETVEFNLTGGQAGTALTGFATFHNIKCDWNDYSDQTELTNAIKTAKKYTALKADYFGPTELEANMPFDEDGIKEYLKVYAIYDDGTERQLDESEYTVCDQLGNTIERTPKVGGIYPAIITHEEKDVIKSDTFHYKVSGPVRYTVSFETNGGTSLNSMTVFKYDSVENTASSESQYTTTKAGFEFDGWYEDQNLTKKYDLSTEVLSDLMLYAKWTDRPAALTYSANTDAEVNNMPSNVDMTYGTDTYVSTDIPTRSDGYAFIGWSTDQNANLESTWYDANALIHSKNTMPTAITLYAQWYDVDTLEAKINSCVRSGDFGITNYQSKSIEFAKEANKSYTLSDFKENATLPSTRKNLGSTGFYSSNAFFNIFAADDNDFQAKNNDVNGSRTTTFHTYILNVLKRNGAATNGSVDARICLMQNTAAACLVSEDIQVISNSKDNVSTASLENNSIEITPAKTGYTYVAPIGWQISNGSSSGTRWACANAYRAYKSGSNFVVNFRNKSGVTSKIKLTVNSMMVKNKSVETDIEWIPDIDTYGTRSKARLAALEDLAIKANDFFTSDNLQLKSVSWTNITCDGTSGSSGSSTLTLSEESRIIGPTGYDYSNGTASTSKNVTWCEPKGFWTSEIGSGSYTATISHKEAGNYSVSEGSWSQPIKMNLTVKVLCIVK